MVPIPIGIVPPYLSLVSLRDRMAGHTTRKPCLAAQSANPLRASREIHHASPSHARVQDPAEPRTFSYPYSSPLLIFRKLIYVIDEK
jgi:hypothetical protein